MPSRTLAVGFATLLVAAASAAGSDSASTPAPLLRMGGGATPTDVCRLVFTPDGKTIACMAGGRVALYDPATGKLRWDLKTDARCVAFALDSKTIAMGVRPSVQVFDAAAGKDLFQFKAHADGVRAVAFSPDGKTLATAGEDDHVILWNAADGKERARAELHEKGASLLAFSPDGKYLTAAGDAGELTVWRLDDDYLDERRRLTGRGGAIGFVGFLPEGKSFLWTQGHTIRVSENETWVELLRYDSSVMDAVCIALAPDGKTLATGDRGAIQLWDLETGEELMTLRDDKCKAGAVAFAPDGKTLASAAPDGTVLVWDIKGLRLARQEMLWRELGGRDAADAVHAVRAMNAAPAESIDFLRERLRPPPPPDPRIARLIADLDSDDFEARQKATAELAKHGAIVKPQLQSAYAGAPSPEARWRLERLLAPLQDAPSEETAKVRAVQVLETIGTDEARRLLEAVAKGPADLRLTKEAKAALQRLGTPH